MNELSIRTLVESELDALLALYRYLHEADAPLPARAEVEAVWREMLGNPRITVLGGFVGEALVCACVLSLTPNLTRGCRPYALIENVVTHPDFRRQGYGRALLEAAKARAWAAGCYKAMLLTGRKEASILDFYESAGFDRHTKQAFYAAPN